MRLSSSSWSPSAAGEEKEGEIESLAGLWRSKVVNDARSLSSSFGKGSLSIFLVEETRNVEQVVAVGVHEVRERKFCGRWRRKVFEERESRERDDS